VATTSYYDRRHAESRELFAGLSDARLAEKCQTPAGAPITIGKWLRAAIEHEAHHRGQLYFILASRRSHSTHLWIDLRGSARSICIVTQPA
jgi:uncharacterized damage-inducible protein DinB